MRKFAFIIPPAVEILDLAGPLQVFTEAKTAGFDIELEFYNLSDETACTSGLRFDVPQNFTNSKLKEDDFIFIPGMDWNYVESFSFRAERKFFNWLKECSDKKMTVCAGHSADGKLPGPGQLCA